MYFIFTFYSYSLVRNIFTSEEECLIFISFFYLMTIITYPVTSHWVVK